MDTDEEVSNGRVNILNGSGPPYFHSYLYMKGEYIDQWHPIPYIVHYFCPGPIGDMVLFGTDTR